MNDLQPVGLVIGSVTAVLGASMVLPLIADLISGNGHWQAFALASVVTVTVGLTLSIACRRHGRDGLSLKQAFILTTGVFVVLPIFGALPFVFGAPESQFVDAFFEAMSGLTTTGATVLSGIEQLPTGILLWRGMLQWFGGLGIIVVAIVFLPLLRVGGMQLFHWDSYDTVGSLLPRIVEVTRSISAIYVVLTILCAFFYATAGMKTFDAAVHAMTTIATGGFANYDNSFAGFSPGVEYVASVFMVLAALPFLRYVQFVGGTMRPILHDTQIRGFFLFVACIVCALAFWHVGMLETSSEQAFRKSLFNGVSILTGTGFVSDVYDSWGNFPIAVFFFIGLVGGCAGSTSCSIKVFRFQLLFAFIRAQLRRVRMPHAIPTPRYNGARVPEEVLTSVMTFFAVFLATLCVTAVLLAMTGEDFMTSVSGAAAALANIGPGLGDRIGPDGNYSDLSDSAKWILSAVMLIGRLELISVYSLLTLKFWRS